MSKLAEKNAAARAAVVEARNKGTASGSGTGETAPPSPMFPKAPGAMHGAVSTMKVEFLKAEVEALKAGKPVLKLKTSEIKPSKWANRDKDSYRNEEFASLKSEIESAGGNIQAIKVSPLKPEQVKDGYKYEIVFGHRRHKACSELGLDVNAIVEELDGKSLFVQMDRENRQRADLRPYEQGVMYAKALDDGMFPSIRKLAEELGVDFSNASKVIAIARLPEVILNCFASRLDIQFRWMRELSEKMEKDLDVVLARADDINNQKVAGNVITSQEALNLLIGNGGMKNNVGQREVKVGTNVLKITEKKNKVSFEVNALGREKLGKIEKFIAELMKD